LNGFSSGLKCLIVLMCLLFLGAASGKDAQADCSGGSCGVGRSVTRTVTVHREGPVLRRVFAPLRFLAIGCRRCR